MCIPGPGWVCSKHQLLYKLPCGPFLHLVTMDGLVSRHVTKEPGGRLGTGLAGHSLGAILAVERHRPHQSVRLAQPGCISRQAFASCAQMLLGWHFLSLHSEDSSITSHASEVSSSLALGLTRTCQVPGSDRGTHSLSQALGPRLGNFCSRLNRHRRTTLESDMWSARLGITHGPCHLHELTSAQWHIQHTLHNMFALSVHMHALVYSLARCSTAMHSCSEAMTKSDGQNNHNNHTQ